MKRILLIISSLALVFGLASCNKEKDVMPIENEQGFTYVFSIGDNDAIGTRASLASEDGQSLIAWDDDDKIGTQAGSQKGYSHVAVSNGVATFRIYSQSALQVGDFIYCYYPHTSNQDIDNISMSIPAAQQMKATGFDVSAMPMISIPYEVKTTLPYSSNNSTVDVINFAYLGSLIDFRIYTTNSAYGTEKIEWIQFESTALSGNFSFTGARAVDYSNKSSLSIPAVTGTTVKTAFASSTTVGDSKNNAVHAYMVVAPGEHAGTVTVKTDKAEYVYNVSAKDYKRAVLKPLNVDLANAAEREAPEVFDFEKVTSAPVAPETWQGEYLIVTTDGKHVAKGEISNKGLASVDVTPNADGTITCADEYAFSINEQSTGEYVIKTSGGKYVAWGGSSTDVKLSDDVTDDAKFTLSISDNHAVITNVSAGNRYIRWNGSSIFKIYTSTSGNDIDIYKKIETRVLTSISLSGTYPTSFYKDDAFDYTGLVVTAHYDNNTERVVLPSSVTGFDMSSVGEQTVTVSYTEKGVTKTTTYIITVLALPVLEEELTTNGLPEEFGVGAAFSFGTGSVTAHYDNGSTKELTLADVEINGFDSSEETTGQVVTISYSEGEVTASAQVTVNIIAATPQNYSEDFTGQKIGAASAYGSGSWTHTASGTSWTASSVSTELSTLAGNEKHIAIKGSGSISFTGSNGITALSFDYLKPSNAGNMKVTVSNGATNVYDVTTQLSKGASGVVSLTTSDFSSACSGTFTVTITTSSNSLQINTISWTSAK